MARSALPGLNRQMKAQFRAAFDGGSRGNPGPAAWGVAVLDQSGDLCEGHSGLLGKATNNEAEYHGLLNALRLAGDSGAEQVEILADSELVVRQIQGRYRVKAPGLQPLYREAIKMIGRLSSFKITHVKRDFNKEADRLVNLALDLAE
jgi:ribonuclease HI